MGKENKSRQVLWLNLLIIIRYNYITVYTSSTCKALHTMLTSDVYEKREM